MSLFEILLCFGDWNSPGKFSSSLEICECSDSVLNSVANVASLEGVLLLLRREDKSVGCCFVTRSRLISGLFFKNSYDGGSL